MEWKHSKRKVLRKAEQRLVNEELAPWEHLGMAIVIQAAQDAQDLQKGRQHPNSEGCAIISEVELIRFFESKWCGILLGTTDLTGQDVRRMVGI